jgi:ribosomal protein S27AE
LDDTTEEIEKKKLLEEAKKEQKAEKKEDAFKYALKTGKGFMPSPDKKQMKVETYSAEDFQRGCPKCSHPEIQYHQGQNEYICGNCGANFFKKTPQANGWMLKDVNNNKIPVKGRKDFDYGVKESVNEEYPGREIPTGKTPKHFSMVVDMSNKTFERYADAELSRILKATSKKIESGETDGSIKDNEGTMVGKWSIS